MTHAPFFPENKKRVKGTLDRNHPLRKLFRQALDFSFRLHPHDKIEVKGYLEEEILCEFIQTENLYKIRDSSGRRLEDIADMLSEGDILLSAWSFSREFLVHKHIGDYTLFMLGMFPAALLRRKGKEFTLGSLVVPGSDLFEHYIIQGKRSYTLASEFTDRELFLELSANFLLYRNVLELVGMYFESSRSREFLKVKRIIGGTD